MRKRTIIVELAMIVIVASVYGQPTPTVSQTSKRSTCSNIVAITGAKVNCSNLTDAQKKAIANIPAILEMTLTNQDYLEAIIAKLDAIKQANQPQTVINAPSCPGGICSTGTTFGNQTVINTPPPSSVEGFEMIDSDPKEDNNGHPITSFRFYISEPVADQKFVALCDRPCHSLGADSLPTRSMSTSNDVLPGKFENEPLLAAWIINYPIHAGQYQKFTVVSEDNSPVKVFRVSLAKFPVKPQ